MRVLRAAGLDPDAEELADALWLAAARGGPVPATAAPAGRPPVRRSGEPPREPAAAPRPGPGPAAGPDRPADPQVTLYAPGRPGPAGEPAGSRPAGAAVPVRVPAAGALPRILDIQRALRALQRHRPPAPPARLVLDETATADASARALGLAIPVMRPENRRETTLRLVLDASPSMAVWRDLFDELRGVCERLGAFRDVQVHHLHRLPDGTAAVGRGPEPDTPLRSGEQLRDPTGRGLTMVVSDCAGPVWREGGAQRLLYRWTECTPSVIVQPLPQRLWARTWLPTERGLLARTEDPAGPLRFAADRPPLPGRPRGGLAVPVLPPSAPALGAWARLVAGLGDGAVPAEVGRVLAAHPAVPLPPPRAARPARDLVRRFRSSAAPRAVQLAVYLAATPLNLPVMRMVQRTMLPGSEPSDLAEVLLSGLLRRTGPGPGEWYEFVDGVQDVLLGPLGRDEAALVLKHCSEYVLQHFGRGVRNFPALAAAQLTGAPPPEAVAPTGAGAGEASGRPAPARLPQAFAQVSAKVVHRYLPAPDAPAGVADPAVTPPAPDRAAAVATARGRLAVFDRDGNQGALHEAVAVLRRATAAAGHAPGEAEAELAGALLRLWQVQRDPELLAEAERAARQVAGLPGLVRARAVLGRVLYERATDPAAAAPAGPGATGARGGAVAELLAAADREFAAVGAAPGAEPALRLDCVLRRAEVLTRLAVLRGDPGALHDALAALEEFDVGERARGAARDGDLQLALGRVLAALAERAGDPAGRTELARRAAVRLDAGLAALVAAAADDPPGHGSAVAARHARARARLDLATALRHLPDRLDEALAQAGTALDEATGDPELRLAGLVRLARVHLARWERYREPAALEAAADAYARARRLVPRDADAYGELLAEWGEVLLELTWAVDGRRYASQAVRVLRDSRAAVPQHDERYARRLTRLAWGLRLRHDHEGDLVDLREAEYLLELAVRHGRSPLERARAWREHGDVQQEIHRHTRAADRLDRAADSYRRAWRAALEADAGERRGAALALAARVQQLRGEVLERLERPRAALDAYRSALELWQWLDAAPAAADEGTAGPWTAHAGGPDARAAPGDQGLREAVRARARALGGAL
ncbi:SAV_2336 N-terminal domain-related protein [Streptomyces sp. NRRL S-87]|uniref:SAV_2336 N-terminal domain-related protein n=1 Tax=Streptomyces sp. NRRL S-87 TaxID=1463920 RepID=UPI00068AE12C|nr:SAV_2336 N-terminal domain-related protein [Streptomyces sp. NRRL S-87]